jgi:hypothetical protein
LPLSGKGDDMKAFHLSLAAASLFLATATAALADNFGAIAYSQHDGASSHSFDYGSRDEAEERAMQECGPGCAVVLWFKNGCGALGGGQGYGYGVGWGSNREEAESLALSACRERTGECAAVRWACTTR